MIYLYLLMLFICGEWRRAILALKRYRVKNIEAPLWAYPCKLCGGHLMESIEYKKGIGYFIHGRCECGGWGHIRISSYGKTLEGSRKSYQEEIPKWNREGGTLDASELKYTREMK